MHAFLLQMAQTSAFSSKRNSQKTLTIFLLLLLFLVICIFLFSRKAIEPKLSVYTNLNPQTTLQISTHIYDHSDKFQEENNEGTKVTILSKSNLDESKERFEEKTEDPISSKSDLGKETNEEKADTISSKFDLDESKQEKTDEPISSDEEISNSSLSKSDLGKETNEVKVDLISSKFELDQETSEKTSFDVPDESVSSDTDSDDNEMKGKLQNCDICKGTWVKDENYPLYQPGSCPYVDEAFDCQNNGRPDFGYLKWRWKPDECELPRFNATYFLVRLRGKRLMLVGDSMNRNQFESLLCLLREGLTDKRKMYEVHGYKITKGRGQFIFKFEDYDCSVEFVRSHFLVREGIRINAKGNSNPILSIDRIDKSAPRWKRADILVFNTGHWWTHGKTSRGKNYYKEGNYIYPQFDAVEAYKRAIRTWGKWIKRNAGKKLAIYRSYSSAHFRGGDWDSGGTCKGETEPAFSGNILDNYPLKMRIVEEVIREMQVPAVLLNVTRLTNYRKDGHPSVHRVNATSGKKVSNRRQDCSHWCLPGVPDAWNELIYATLIARGF